MLLVLIVSLLLASTATTKILATDTKAEVSEDGKEQYEFQADVNRLMDIIIHSLYSNRDVFLRELISNSADALDKMKFISLTELASKNHEKSVNGSLSDFDIRIRFDEDHGILEVMDTGLGMTKQELVNNLGTVAKSGTSEFVQKAMEEIEKSKKEKKGKDAKDSTPSAFDSTYLIGQFGVGFYSAFLAADQVDVYSISYKEPGVQHKWSSTAHGIFTVSTIEDVPTESAISTKKLEEIRKVAKDDKGEEKGEDEAKEEESAVETFESPFASRLTRGTRIVLHLKPDAKEYAKKEKVKDLVKKYSQFISFPIYLEAEESVLVEEPEEEKEKEAKPAEEDGAKEDELKVEETDEETKKGETKEPKYEKKILVTRLNDQLPVWTRDPSEVTEQEYSDFYNSLDRMPGEPFAHTHFKAEGEVEFKALLYIQSKRPFNYMMTTDTSALNSIKLFVRRVLIADSFEEPLLPAYLSFITGVVDSDDLPINVSREMLQQSRILDLIRRKLIRKALEMIRSLMVGSGNTEDEDAGDEGAEEVADKAKDGNVKPTSNKYLDFWKEFGRGIKWGVIEDPSNRNRLSKMLRFRSSKCDPDNASDFISLDQYLDRMKGEQEFIYYHSGENEGQIRSSPFLEKLKEREYEVLYLTDPMDENMLSHLKEYDGIKFVAASKDNFKLGETDEMSEKNRIREANKAFRPLKKFIKDKMSDRVAKVKISHRLTTSPCVVSTSQYGYSARMELIMRAQAFSSNSEATGFVAETVDPLGGATRTAGNLVIPHDKILELNPFHPLTIKLLDMVNHDPDSAEALDMLNFMYDSAVINSGYHVADSVGFSDRLYHLLAKALNIDVDKLVPVEEIVKRKEIVEKRAKANDDSTANLEDD